MYANITTISIRQAKQIEREDPQSSDPCGQYARHKKNKQDLLCANIVVISAVQPLSEPPTPHVVAGIRDERAQRGKHLPCQYLSRAPAIARPPYGIFITHAILY